MPYAFLYLGIVCVLSYLWVLFEDRLSPTVASDKLQLVHLKR